MDRNSSVDDVSVLSRRDREKMMRRKEMIDAARIVFAQKGFAMATLEDVAERAEFGKGTLYNYFPNKEALFAAVLEDSFRELVAICQNALTADLPFSEKIKKFISDELMYFFTHIESTHLMAREAHFLREGNPMMVLLPQLLSMLSDTIAEEQKKGTVIEVADPLELATIIMNLLFGQVMSRVFKHLCVVQRTSEQVANGNRVNNAMIEDLAEKFKKMGKEHIQRQVNEATQLIHAIYFNGISKQV